MKTKEILQILKKIENTERNITIDDKLITITYGTIFDKLSVRILYNDQTYFLRLFLNERGDLSLDLTEDGKLLETIGSLAYHDLISVIFRQEV